MFHSPSSLTSPRAATARVGMSPARTAHECVAPATGTATWQAACRAACSCCAAVGAARALTAPTLTATTAAPFAKEHHVFPAAPTWMQYTSTPQASAARIDFVAAGAAGAGVSLNLPQNQAISRILMGAPPSSSGGIHAAFSAPRVIFSEIGDSGDGGGDHGNSSPASLSRRGLSVHAAPFQPHSATDLSALSSTLDLTEMGDANPIRDGQRWSRNGEGRTVAGQQQGIEPPALEFPRTPLARETHCVRLSTPVSNTVNAAALHAPLMTSLGVGDSKSWSTPCVPLSPCCSNQQQRPVHYGTLGGGTSTVGLVCFPDAKDGSCFDNIRHRRVPFTDAEAMDEDAMLDQLRGSSSDDNDDDDEEEDHIVYMEHQQQHVFDFATVLPANLGLYNCAGGYWDLEGPRAATRRFLRRGTSSTASLSLPAQGGTGSPVCIAGKGLTTEHGIGEFNDGAEDDDDLWEMNSSAYADSLDEAQLEWIEQQLHAKENPDDFFF